MSDIVETHCSQCVHSQHHRCQNCMHQMRLIGLVHLSVRENCRQQVTRSLDTRGCIHGDGDIADHCQQNPAAEDGLAAQRVVQQKVTLHHCLKTEITTHTNGEISAQQQALTYVATLTMRVVDGLSSICATGTAFVWHITLKGFSILTPKGPPRCPASVPQSTQVLARPHCQP